MIVSENFMPVYISLLISKLTSGFFLNDLMFPRISEEHVNLLNSPITQLDVDKAISILQSGKSPGPDGYPAEILR